MSDRAFLAEEQGRALRLAAIAGDVDAALRLLQSGVPIDAADSYGFTPLMLAAKRGHRAVVFLLLELGASVTHVTDNGSSAIKFAVMIGDESIVAALLNAGANASEVYDQFALLDLAVSSAGGDESAVTVVRLLLKAGADPRGGTRGSVLDALSSAAMMGRIEVARELIAAGARFSDQKSYNLALGFARVKKNAEFVRLLEPLEPIESSAAT